MTRPDRAGGREMVLEVLAILPVEGMGAIGTSCDRWVPLLAYKRLPLSDPNCWIVVSFLYS